MLTTKSAYVFEQITNQHEVSSIKLACAFHKLASGVRTTDLILSDCTAWRTLQIQLSMLVIDLSTKTL